MSYFVRYRAVQVDGEPRRYLLGGVTESQSGRFQTVEMAERYKELVLETNGSHCVGEVHESPLYPEIFIHCGTVATAIGCVCPGCRKILKIDDAKAAMTGSKQ